MNNKKNKREKIPKLEWRLDIEIIEKSLETFE